LKLLPLQAASATITFLTTIKSPRSEEFRTACDAKFELSTVFKNAGELAVLQKQVLAGNDGKGDDDIDAA